MAFNDQRIAIFLPDLSLGGAERSMINLAEGFVEAGISVDFVLAKAEGVFLKELPGTVRLIDLKARRTLTSFLSLARYLRHERPPVLLACLHANIPAIIASCLAFTSTRIYVSERNTPSVEAENFRDIRMKWMPFLDRFFYPRAEGIIAVSKGVALDLIQKLGIPSTQVQVINNPIITPEFQAKVQKPLEHTWFEKNERPVILAVGRFTEAKDFATLIRAFAMVRQSRLARLLILGEGEQKAALVTLIHHLNLEQDVSLAGFVQNPYPFMLRAAGFVLSSRWEGLPGVLIEALYCGVPIIATNCPSGPEEILNYGQYGRLVPVGDATSMAEALIDLLDGKIARPPEESWLPYKLETVLGQYLKVFFGKSIQ